jgi:PhnB protein
VAVQLNPYLSFRDNAREAMEFYRSVFGGELTMTTFAEFNASDDPAEQDKVMHAMLVTEAGFTLMGSDTPSAMEYKPGNNYSVSLSGDDEPTLRRYWDQLAADGTVIMALDAAPWGDTFGMCLDRFGVSWLVNIAGRQSD